MKIIVRCVATSSYKELIIKDLGTTINVGVLDKNEQKQLAQALRDAADDLYKEEE